MDRKTSQLIRGMVLLVLGIFVAVFGGNTVLDTYFAIVSLVAGISLFALSGYRLAQKLPLSLGSLMAASVLTIIGIALFTDKLTLSVVISLIVFTVMGCGVGFVLFGIYTIAKRDIFFGSTQLIIGIVSIVLSILYIEVPKSREVFWIIIGIIIALYGIAAILAALTLPNGSAKKANSGK